MIATEPTPVMLSAALVYARAALPLEGCGVFFYPDQRLAVGAGGRPITGVPMFVAIPNTAADPASSFEFDYLTMARRIGLAYWGVPAGQVQLWHAHPDTSGPSPEDHAMVDQLAAAMAGHPTWGVALEHRLLSLGDETWWSYTSAVAERTMRA